jgi:histidinol-phosphate/aromatic aminotransferase/cobyric acid decarboxylase-like protein
MNSKEIKNKLRELKSESGSHSPSIGTMLNEIPELKIKVDACFLSNPYATDLFIDKFNALAGSKELRDILEYYPPQNYDVAKKVSKIIKIDSDNIFVGNGAIEVIQAAIHNFAGKNIALPIPTFSSYYEFKRPNSNLEYYQLEKNNNYQINIEDYINFIKVKKCDTAILINPNNPTGEFVSSNSIKYFLNSLKDLDLIIIDESFIHFAYEDDDFKLAQNESLIYEYPNLIIIKSMSKDFGIAGIRAGYGIMNKERVKQLVSNGYLWNVSGLCDYFFSTYGEADFQEKYEQERKRYILDTISFVDDLTKIVGIKVYKTKANFVLIEILSNQISSFDMVVELLVDKGIYIRDCADKIGLNGEFVRIASRSKEENHQIVTAIDEFSKQYLLENS